MTANAIQSTVAQTQVCPFSSFVIHLTDRERFFLSVLLCELEHLLRLSGTVLKSEMWDRVGIVSGLGEKFSVRYAGDVVIGSEAELFEVRVALSGAYDLLDSTFFKDDGEIEALCNSIRDKIEVAECCAEPASVSSGHSLVQAKQQVLPFLPVSDPVESVAAPAPAPSCDGIYYYFDNEFVLTGAEYKFLLGIILDGIRDGCGEVLGDLEDRFLNCRLPIERQRRYLLHQVRCCYNVCKDSACTLLDNYECDRCNRFSLAGNIERMDICLSLIDKMSNLFEV